MMVGKIKTQVVCLSEEVIKRFSRALTLVFYIDKIWRLFPILTMRYYRRRRLKHDSIVLLIHQGLGDLAAMAAAIKELSKEHKEVYIVAVQEFFNAISLIFDFDDNIKNIPAIEGKTREHKVSTQRLQELKQYGYVIKFGLYDTDPIFRYPNSFYIKMGCPPALAERRFPFDFSKYRSMLVEEFLRHVGQKFVFFSNETTDGYLDTSSLDEIESNYSIITFASNSPTQKSERFHDISALNKNDFTRSLLNSLYLCYLSEYVIVSDAGLFNILIRLENNIDIRVIWRKHPHSLNKGIYGQYIREKL